jgi:tetratricopeptide (TPR) repeat protein
LELAETAFNAGNFAEAYDYYSKVLEIDIKNTKAWFGKGKAAGWQSTIWDSRFSEMISAFQKSIAYSPKKDTKSLQIQCASEISQLFAPYYDQLRKYAIDQSSEKKVWDDYLSQSKNLISLLEFGHSLDPDNREIILGIIRICKNILEGMPYEYYTRNGPVQGARRVSEGDKRVLSKKIDEYSTDLKKIDPNYQTSTIPRKSISIAEGWVYFIAIIIVIMFLLWIFNAL